MLEYTLIGVKPDAFHPQDAREAGSELKKPLPRNPEDFIGELRVKLRNKALELVAEKTYLVPEAIAAEHYEEHRGVSDSDHGGVSKYDFLLGYITSGPSHWMVLVGEDAIRLGREAIVETREEYLTDRKLARYNMTHGSDSIDGARKEILLHFPDFTFRGISL